MHITLSMHFNSSTRRVVCTVHVCTNVGYKVRFAPYTTYSRLHSSCQYARATCYSRSKYTYYAYYVASTCILFRGGYLYIYIYPSFSSFLFWFWSPFHQCVVDVPEPGPKERLLRQRQAPAAAAAVARMHTPCSKYSTT